MPDSKLVKIDDRVSQYLLTMVSRRLRKPRRMMSLVVGEVAKLVRDNFRRLDKERSRYGHHFYIREGEQKTRSEAAQDGLSGTVKIESYQMLHKLRGGTVRPRKKFLAIPVSDWAKSQNRNPGDIAGLDLYIGERAPYLAREGPKGQPLQGADWILLRSVTHKPRREVLPSGEEQYAVVRNAVRLFLSGVEQEWQRNI